MTKRSKELAEIVARFDGVKVQLADLKIDLARFVCENRDDNTAALILRAIDLTTHRLASEFELLEFHADDVAKLPEGISGATLAGIQESIFGKGFCD